MGIVPEEAYWYAARVRSGETSRAISNLQNKAINHLHPVGHLIGGIEYPITPGYLFVLLPPSMDAWSEVKALPGIDRLLPVGREVPGVIPRKFMAEFIARLRSGDYDESVVTHELPRFHRNESVAINTGPFSGYTGKFCRVHKGAVILKVPFFGQTLEAVFQWHQVSKVN